ncbi:hypothetical protein O3G_MSEX013671 [Manduca sexta]|uniref:Peptidase S1 domain-containing protein n=1 Tax=Manduca sexta TaxID=7130 RepID=A0A921ZSS3_MANSE|nr:hypothetical protein O3G_MSEX013671 [Manduca sexta]KAG6463105.1 hypothetical protein O3G_MSEX013671 [Manduca sexta]
MKSRLKCFQLFIFFLFDYVAKGHDYVLNITKTGTEDIEGKIVGGEPVSLESFPFQVQIFNYGSMCSGSIINSWTVLTAAHCFDVNKNIHEMRVQAGSRYVYDFNAKIYDVKTFVVHRKYNNTAQFANDIALLFVDGPIQLGNVAKKAILVNNDAWMSPKEKNFKVTGWGWTQYGGPISDLGLMMTHLKFVPSKECSRLHNLKIGKDMFCLYGDGKRDTCKGDSGGGVLWKGLIVGITSHGDGCAKKHKPSVYANVWYFRKWIEHNLYRFYDIMCRR